MSEQTTSPPEPPSKPKRKQKPPSRAERWGDAVADAQSAIEQMAGNVDDLESALSELRSVQEEYEECKDNLPENLQSSPVGEKLDEVCGIEIEGVADTIRDAIEAAQDAIGNAEGVELPQGFGRD